MLEATGHEACPGVGLMLAFDVAGLWQCVGNDAWGRPMVLVGLQDTQQIAWHISTHITEHAAVALSVWLSTCKVNQSLLWTFDSY